MRYILDSQERLIIRELIRDPRISDNQIAARTNVPLKSVNRKRKILEEKELLSYFCYYNNTTTGSETFMARCLFIITLRDGITRKRVLDSIEKGPRAIHFFPKHVYSSHVAEQDGNVSIIMIIESNKQDDIIEIYNAEVVPELEQMLGPGCIKRCVNLPLSRTVRMLKNYLPDRNMRNGKIREDWPLDGIFIDD